MSCYEKKIQGIRGLFKNSNISVSNKEIVYKIKKCLNINNLYSINANLLYIKDLNKNKLTIKNENQDTLAILENNQIIFKGSNFLYKEDSVMKLIYNIFLHSNMELDDILHILNIKEFNKTKEDNFFKIFFKDGYILYNENNKTIKEIYKTTYKNNIRFDNKLSFKYKNLNKVLLLNKFKLESRYGNNILTLKEVIE